MKIAVLASHLVPTHPAGSQMLKVVRGLAEEYDFTVFGAAIDKSLEGKVQFYKMPIPLRPMLLSYLTSFLLYGHLFKKLKLDKNFDIVHALEISSPFASVVSLHFCFHKMVELMKIGTIRYKDVRRPYRNVLYKIGARMERSIVKNPYLRRLVVVSEGLKREIMYIGSSVAPQVIPNGIDVERFGRARQYREAMRRKLGLREGEPVGAICGLGDWQRKGLDLVIEAVALLPQNSLKILVIGGGPIQIYQKLVKKMGVAEAFIFTGLVHNVEKFYAAGDFFIFPTAYEALPLVVLEAAATGLPPLVTRVSGVEEFVEHGVSGLFIEREPRGIASAIASVVDDRQRLQEMGIEAQHRVQAFSVENMVNAYRRLYEGIRDDKYSVMVKKVLGSADYPEAAPGGAARRIRWAKPLSRSVLPPRQPRPHPGGLPAGRQ